MTDHHPDRPGDDPTTERVRALLHDRAATVTPRRTYADLEARLAAAPAPRRRPPAFLLAAAALLVVALGLGAVAVASRTSDDEQDLATVGPTTAVTETTPTTGPGSVPDTTAAVPVPPTPTTAPPTSTPETTTTTSITPDTAPATTLPVRTAPAPLDDSAGVVVGSIGGLTMPSSIADAEVAIGRRLTLDATCPIATPEGGPAGVRFMTDGDRVVRVDVTDPSPIRAQGVGGAEAAVGIGSTVDEVRAAFPGLTEEPHKYTFDTGGTYLVVTDPARPGLELRFETDGTRVTTFRTGVTEFVQLVESC